MEKADDEKSDDFAFGSLLQEIVTRDAPADSLDIYDKGGEHALKLPFGMNKNVARLVEDCRSFDMSIRPSFAEILASLEAFLV